PGSASTTACTARPSPWTTSATAAKPWTSSTSVCGRTGRPSAPTSTAAWRASGSTFCLSPSGPAHHNRAPPPAARPVSGPPDSDPTVSGREGFAGLMRGCAGQALFLLRMHDETGDTAYLDLAAVALRRDLRRCVIRADSGAMEVNEGWRTMPYLEAGSVGVG